MRCQLFAILPILFTAVPALAGDLMLYSQDYDDGSGNPQATIAADVRPGQTITVSASIYTAQTDSSGKIVGWESDTTHPASEFNWAPGCDSTQPSCPSVNPPGDGDINVTVNVPACMVKGSVTITVTHIPQPEGDQTNYSAARLVLTNSEDPPGGCPPPGAANLLPGMGGPVTAGLTGPTSSPDQPQARTQAQNANPYGGGGGYGNGGEDDGWNSGWRNNRRRNYDNYDDGGFGGGYSAGTPGYNRGNAASAEVEDCAWQGTKLRCSRVPDPPRGHAYYRYLRHGRRLVRPAPQYQPHKRPAPQHAAPARTQSFTR
jgi:hypothetical protein